MFDEKSYSDSNNQEIGLFTTKNDKTIDTVPLTGLNKEFKQISLDHVLLTNQSSGSDISAEEKIQTASKHAQKFEPELNTLQNKISEKSKPS